MVKATKMPLLDEVQERNMELWLANSDTDMRFTKDVSFGNRKYTTIVAQYQMMNATKQWGPYGSVWGVKDCKYEYLRNGAGEIIEVILDAVFYYPGGSFEISADMPYKIKNDSRKKLLTDLTTKALSKLGFNADIFLDKKRLAFTDNKYHDKEEKKKPNGPKASEANMTAILNKLTKVQDISEAETLAQKYKDHYDFTDTQLDIIVNCIESRKIDEDGI